MNTNHAATPSRIVARIPEILGGNTATSDLPEDYNGPTKMCYDNHAAVFPTQDTAIGAAGAALRPDIGGFSNVSLVAPAPGEGITHQDVLDWLAD
jgi:hypothetical protein